MNQRFLLASVFVCLLLLPSISSAATEYATFESFYHSSSKLPWILGGVAALVTGAVIFFTGGTASPIVVSVGTWIGGLMGFSGIAATNAGLALLGGGSIASGGWGIIGGTTLLAAALTFGTEVTIDFATTKAVESYEYSKFVEDSKSMTTLPLPVSSSGSDSYEASVKVLGKISKDEHLSSDNNQKIIDKAINTLNNNYQKGLSSKDRARENSLLALLYFSKYNYIESKKFAERAIQDANKARIGSSLPAYILATSSLYDDNLDLDKSMALFEQSVTHEIENPIIPFMFSAFLDRMFYRLNDGYQSTAKYDRIYGISKQLPYDERKAIVQMGLLNRYMIKIYLDQETIRSLTETSNATIRSNPKTLTSVKAALAEYESLLNSASKQIDARTSLLKSRKRDGRGWVAKAKGKSLQDWEARWLKDLDEKRLRVSQYLGNVDQLKERISALENFQKEAEIAKSTIIPVREN